LSDPGESGSFSPVVDWYFGPKIEKPFSREKWHFFNSIDGFCNDLFGVIFIFLSQAYSYNTSETDNKICCPPRARHISTRPQNIYSFKSAFA
jgi:hypothetical protein